MADYVEVVEAGPGWTKVRTADGQVLTVEGNRNWRNNNPGNIEYGDFARSMGAVGTDGRFAVFPSYETGRDAKSKLVFESPSYLNARSQGGYPSGSIGAGIYRYAPPSENDTEAYISGIGIDPNTPLSALSADQRLQMLDAMQRIEGWRVGTINGQAPPQIANVDQTREVPRPQPRPNTVPRSLMSYAGADGGGVMGTKLPNVGPTGGPALEAIANATTGKPADGFWKNPVSSLMSMVPPMPQISPEQKQSLMSAAVGSLPVRTAFVKSLMNQNVGSAPTINQGHAGSGTRAMAVTSSGTSPVTLGGSLMRSAAPPPSYDSMLSHGGGNGGFSGGGQDVPALSRDVYRANAAVLGPGGFDQANIGRALSGGQTLYRLT